MDTRNHNIWRIHGCAYLFRNLPKDVQIELGKDDTLALSALIRKVEQALDTVKVKRYTCLECAAANNVQTGIATKALRAHICDYCNDWQDPLYIILKKGTKCTTK